MQTVREADMAMDAAVAAGDYDEAMRAAERADELAADSMPSLLGASLWYAEQGLPVFPLQPGSKIPMPGSHGCKDATTDPAQVRAWWTRTPDANIGLATGHVVDVVDIDGHVGQRSRLEHWCYDDECRAAGSQTHPPAEWTEHCEHDGVFNRIDRDAVAKVLTPRVGGMHIYVPLTGMSNGTNIAPGVDARGRGGYVVAPPSRTDVGMYRFLGTPTLTGLVAGVTERAA